MAIKLNQSLKQTQQLAMTPQLQQAIKLLTLTHLEMTHVIAKELVENPMLEETGTEATLEEGVKDVDRKLEKLEMDNKESSAENLENTKFSESSDDFDWSSYIDSFNSTSSSPPSMAKRDLEETINYENMVSRGAGLAEHLEWQLRMESLTEDEWKVAHQIIHNISDEGYLETTIEAIVKETGHDKEDAEEILEMIKKLDPVGCGSSSLKECLLAQAKAFEDRAPLVEIIISDYLEDLRSKDYNGIAKATGVDREKVKDAEMVILGLNPKPGRLVSIEEIEYIVPDIYVHEVSGELTIHLNDEGVPRLKISNLYKEMLKTLKSDSESNEAKEYVQDKLRGAMWLIKSIQNRQKTIYRVAEAIVKYQPNFFKKGAEHLKPMILKDIANEIGVHESTVSRVTTNKYMHTPLGTFELKYFFNSGVGGKNGGVDIASESLKLKIKVLIDNENKKRPLSDQKIVELLGREGIKVARRTVAKYRDILNIASSSKRKRIE